MCSRILKLRKTRSRWMTNSTLGEIRLRYSILIILQSWNRLGNVNTYTISDVSNILQYIILRYRLRASTLKKKIQVTWRIQCLTLTDKPTTLDARYTRRRVKQISMSKKYLNCMKCYATSPRIVFKIAFYNIIIYAAARYIIKRADGSTTFANWILVFN